VNVAVAPTTWTAADLARQFGPMPLDRFCFAPMPGTATEDDLLDFNERQGRLYELVDGVLVEKPMGLPESYLAAALIRILGVFATEHKLGAVTGADGMIRLAPGLVRIPDIAFISWDHFPNRQFPTDRIGAVAPDLAVEVLSASNTRQEMERKRQDYFAAGTRLVWEVDLETRTVTVYPVPHDPTVFREDQTLDGGAVLPGFSLPLRQLFAVFDPQ
jgi:Uma2 family endonuclease